MNYKVLIVDDNEMMQSFLQHILSPSFQVKIVNNGEEALALLAESSSIPNLVVVDSELEGMSGVELLQKIKTTFKSAAVVMLSGKPKDKAVFLQAGADDFFTKPFIPSELHRSLLEIVRNGPLRKTG